MDRYQQCVDIVSKIRVSLFFVICVFFRKQGFICEIPYLEYRDSTFVKSMFKNGDEVQPNLRFKYDNGYNYVPYPSLTFAVLIM